MISAKENVKKLYNHEMPEYLPFFGEGVKLLPIKGYYEMPKLDGEAGYDWFGVHWLWPKGEFAPVPDYGNLLEDIEDWREIVKFPDLDAFDWEKAIETDGVKDFDRENNLMFIRFHNGLFERLHFVMGFENAMCAMLTDPEEVGLFLDALVEHKLKMVDKLAEYYKPDIICYHDDWGTQTGLFFSPTLWRDLFKERTKKIVDYVHSKGIKFDMHSCGIVKELVPELVDDLKVDALNIMSNNDIPALKKITGDKVVYHTYLDVQKYEVLDTVGKLTEEEFREGMRKEMIANAEGGCYLPAIILPNQKFDPIIKEEYEKCKQLLYK